MRVALEQHEVMGLLQLRGFPLAIPTMQQFCHICMQLANVIATAIPADQFETVHIPGLHASCLDRDRE